MLLMISASSLASLPHKPHSDSHTDGQFPSLPTAAGPWSLAPLASLEDKFTYTKSELLPMVAVS